MLKYCALFRVRPEVPGGGRKFWGSRKKCGESGILGVNFLFIPEVPGLGRKFRGSPEVPGVVEFLLGRTLNSRSENGGGKT